MDFISQYLLANSGTKVPIRYTRWCAISLLATTAGRKVYTDHEHFIIFPQLYYCLVGDPSSGKSIAMGKARDMFYDCFPDFPTGVSVTSREDIIKQMASDEGLRTYTDEKGQLIEWRPLANFINELSNFMSFNPRNMIEFLTDAFDSKFVKSGTIARGKEVIINPFVAILSCTTPNYIIETFKASVIGGGFSRRIIFIYESSLPQRVPFAHKSDAAHAAEAWCKQHLVKISNICGPMTWAPGAKKFLSDWFMGIPRTQDPILSGYVESKDIIVQKIASCLALAKPEPKLEYTPELFEAAIAFVEANEDNMSKLTVAAGRNEIAVPQQKLLNLLEDHNGMMIEKHWHRIASTDLSEVEYSYMKRFLKDTDQIFENNVNGENVIFNLTAWRKFNKL